jgi:hypothetical protein
LDIEKRGLESQAQYAQFIARGNVSAGRTLFASLPRPNVSQLGTETPLPKVLRDQALAQVNAQLIENGLIDKETGKVTRQVQQEFNYERKTTLPTAGVIVKGCLDDCNVCEPELRRKISLELESLDLKNQLLRKQIELLEKSQEYRCCPAGETQAQATNN